MFIAVLENPVKHAILGSSLQIKKIVDFITAFTSLPQ